MDVSKDLIAPLLASLITSVVTITVVFTNYKLSYRQFSSEKLWDLKREAYSKILAKCAITRHSYQGLLPLLAFPDLSEDDRKHIREINGARALSTRDELYGALSDGYIVCSKAFLDEFNRCNNLYNFKGTLAEYKKETDYERAERHFQAANDMHEALMKQARRELHITG